MWCFVYSLTENVTWVLYFVVRLLRSCLIQYSAGLVTRNIFLKKSSRPYYFLADYHGMPNSCYSFSLIYIQCPLKVSFACWITNYVLITIFLSYIELHDACAKLGILISRRNGHSSCHWEFELNGLLFFLLERKSRKSCVGRLEVVLNSNDQLTTRFDSLPQTAVEIFTPKNSIKWKWKKWNF